MTELSTDRLYNLFAAAKMGNITAMTHDEYVSMFMELAASRLQKHEIEKSRRWQVAAFERTVALAEERGLRPGHESLGLLHLKHMLDGVKYGLDNGMSASKIGRWLGWAQAALVADHIATLDEMKEINTLASQEEDARHG